MMTLVQSVLYEKHLQSSYKAFTHKLLKLLAHDSRTVVISSLVLVGFLEEKLRDTVTLLSNFFKGLFQEKLLIIYETN